MSRPKWVDFISTSFMICFSPNLYQNIGLKIMYLPFSDHPRAWIYIEIQNVPYVLLVKNLF